MSDQLQKLVQDVAVLKEQNATSADIHGRLDNAIDKLTDIHSMYLYTFNVLISIYIF